MKGSGCGPDRERSTSLVSFGSFDQVIPTSSSACDVTGWLKVDENESLARARRRTRDPWDLNMSRWADGPDRIFFYSVLFPLCTLILI